MSNKLLNNSTSFNIIDNGANLSDHNPISLTIHFTCNLLSNSNPISSSTLKSTPVIRWDKADLTKYYLNSSVTLQNIIAPHHLKSCHNCTCTDHFSLIDQYCNCIISALKSADLNSIPRIIPKTLKSFWNPELNRLKSISIDLHQLWRLIGSPKHNSIINTERLRAKLEYKLGIKKF